ncbi:hypothetical protein NEIELOOT_02700 [Neisseria elongata subsp. glycolytica ATCC 29315]|uniref:Uncharacterized protein n=1 Tax=Neisseria elongata subsp. glycolytica ATCC 29315 TaxID=546263 RepID=D4DUE0_NEIEG|nr:hypothetical protein NEIELOOT_02700 [Neisseria elongata subsp. glycolytica ATCC 29315]
MRDSFQTALYQKQYILQCLTQTDGKAQTACQSQHSPFLVKPHCLHHLPSNQI